MRYHFSIGIVTYLGRYKTYFIPLIRKLFRIFPEHQIIVFINGHYDTARQIRYLRSITSFLSKYDNISYITNLHHQPLARAWNWLILMSRCDKILILNDDININYEFIYNIRNINNMPDMFLINRSYSHFVISKKIIKDIGWFDERFLGLGCEDIDYTFRLAMRGIRTPTFTFHGISDHLAPQTDAGWANISPIDQGIRNSQINRDFFEQKWFCSEHGPVPEKGAFKVHLPIAGKEWQAAPKEEVEEMPNYYPLECLNTPATYHPGRKHLFLTMLATTLGLVQGIFWQLKFALGIRTRLRRIFNKHLNRTYL